MERMVNVIMIFWCINKNIFLEVIKLVKDFKYVLYDSDSPRERFRVTKIIYHKYLDFPAISLRIQFTQFCHKLFSK